MKRSIVKKLSMEFIKQVLSGRVSLYNALKTFKSPEYIASKKLSKSGGFLRKQQMKTITEALAPNAKSAWTSVLFPAEILHPFGISPVTLEVVAGLMSTLEASPHFLNLSDAELVPQTMCTFHRILIGISKSKLLGRPNVVAATSAMCDGNVKSFSWVAKEQGVPFLFLDIPYEYSEQAKIYVKQQLIDIVGQLSDINHIKIEPEKWTQTARSVNRSLDLLKKFYNLRKERFKNLYRGFEVAGLAFTFYYLLGHERLEEILNNMCNDVEAGTVTRSIYKDLYLNPKAKRLMWMHVVPQYDTPLWDWVDNGVDSRIVCDEYSSSHFEPYDEEDFFGSIAERLINHPSNGRLERRIDHIRKVAREYNVDGVIQLSNWGCHQATGNVQLIENALRQDGVPFLNLSSDAADSRNASIEQQRTRIEAFLEQIM